MPRGKKQEDKIVRVKFSDVKTMMFGNSYKPWLMQLEEYLFLLKRNGELEEPIDVAVSNSPWIGWGGLKWCPEDRFQHQLNREGCQDNDPDNPNPRKYEDMYFYRDAAITRKVNKLVSDLIANRY